MPPGPVRTGSREENVSTTRPLPASASATRRPEPPESTPRTTWPDECPRDLMERLQETEEERRRDDGRQPIPGSEGEERTSGDAEGSWPSGAAP
ncbi:hypothetical protein GCM10010272_43500 [Streptomyces lateritius]|nr:hypothetical protein GCM10010272_43500 [Streptomyces lateritius]